MNEERESFGEEGEIIMKNTSTIFWRENKVESIGSSCGSSTKSS